jgi:transposase
MTRDYARAPIGMRVHGRVPRNRGRVLTMLGALALDGICALMTVEGGTTRDVFLRFLTEHLLPTLAPGDVVVMDNLGAHHATGVRALLASVGARPLYMPPYSPDLNPIELCWSKLKGALRSLGARTMHALTLAVPRAAEQITSKDAEGWFRHCGCPAQPA